MNIEILQHINWIAVLVAGLAYFFLGAIWYTALFGKKWQSYNSAHMQEDNAKKGAATIMVISFVLMLVCAFGLALIITRLNLSGWRVGLKLGILTGICFAATAVHISYLYEKRPLGLHLINGLYNVAGNIVAAIIISCWR
jgi:Ca2+/Na+ antiporter